MSDESLGSGALSLPLGSDDDDEPVVIGTAVTTRIINDPSMEREQHALPSGTSQPAGHRDSVLTSAIRDVESTMPITSQSNRLLQVTASNSRLSQRVPAMRLSAFDSPMDKSYMPPPLSPRPPPSPSLESGDEPAEEPIARQNNQVSQQGPSDPEPIKNDEPVSWLDTIDESDGSSCASSVHSVSSLDGAIHRKHLRNNSGSTQAEFDAALDAAVEAAYDDGFEPYEEDRPLEIHQSVLSKAASAMDRLANERGAELAREGLIKAAKLRDRELRLTEPLPHARGSAEPGYRDPEADEEERMIDEMTKEYMLEGFDFDLQSKSALPRQSDSSGFSSGSAWNSSMSSNRTTAGTSLSTVAELPAAHLSTIAQLDLPLPAPPFTTSLPAVSASHPEETSHQPPISTMPSVPSVVAPHGIGVRSRRLSGKDPKHLKIETSILVPHVVQPPLSQDRLSTTAAQGKERKVPPALESVSEAVGGGQTLPGDVFKLPKMPASAASLDITPPTPLPGSSPADYIPIISSDTPDTALTRVTSEDSALAPKSPRHFKPSTTKNSHPPTSLRKNGSSLSLKSRALSLPSPDGSDNSIHTPLSTTFAAFSTRKLNNPAIAPTPTIPTFATDSLAIGGLHLFNSDIQSPSSTGSATQLDSDTDGPIPLEPCPDAHLLRPFWLLRAVYQTLAHPRGGYLSNKLFVPRNIWTVNGVKLKHVDEKIANMDLLTAALLRLAHVDEDDAEAVLEEMQALEKVLDQAQAALARKLGSEVGVNGIGSFFKDATGVVRPATGGSEAGLLGEQKVGAQAKSYLTSWRKLRSKGSAMGLNAHGAGSGAVKNLPKDAFTMPSLPMTGLPAIRFAKRDVKAVTCEGPNANYMGSLVRLCDAVQILGRSLLSRSCSIPLYTPRDLTRGLHGL